MNKRLFSLAVWCLVTGMILAASITGANTFGINAHIPNGGVLDRVTEAGIGWVRIDFVWSLVEKDRDEYDWELYDSVISEIESRGLKILANFHGTPAWATDGPEFSGVPNDPREVQEIVYLAAKRYRGRIHAWGMWNEPNLERFWEGTRTEYIETIVRPGAAGVRAADGEALVCAPDTAHLSSTNWDDWLAQVIRNAGDVIDVVTHHAYPAEGRAIEVTKDLDEDPRFPWEEPSVREILAESGWSGRPFWLTETGVQSAEHGSSKQADFYENLLEDWFGPNPEARWVDRIFFYEVHDPPDPTPWSYGILWSRPDLARKAAFFSYRDFIADAVVDDAEVVAREIPSTVFPGELLDLRITFRNTGTSIWRGSQGYRLRVMSDDWWLTAEPSDLPPGQDIYPGEIVELAFHTRSPLFTPSSQRSVATFHIRMADGNDQPFGQSARATVISSPIPPVEIVTQPNSITLLEGRRTSFSVEVAGSESLEYRWRRNSVELDDNAQVTGSSTSRLIVSGVSPDHEGDYDCVVTNPAGAVVTETAVLSVGEVAPRRNGERRAPWTKSGRHTDQRPFSSD